MLETLRLWRVALRHGADLESLLDVLALLIATQGSATPSASGDSGGDFASQGKGGSGPCLSAGPEGDSDLGGLVARWPAVAAAAWYRCLEEACATATAALRWQAQRQQRTEKEGGQGKETTQQQQQPQEPPLPACALAPATLAECTGRLAALAARAWSEEAEDMRLELGDLGASRPIGIWVWMNW